MQSKASRAITKLQAVIIAVILVIAAAGGGYYYLTLPPKVPEYGPATIRGTVTDSATNTTITGAIVSLDGLTYSTGPSGTYEFNVKVGNYTLSVTVSGYDTKTTSVSASEDKEYTVSLALTKTVVPPPAQILVIGTTDRPTTLDPGSLMTSAAAWLDSWVLDVLVRNNPETNEIEPWLAKNWTISSDGKTLDFFLEEDVMWHDGTELTAEDVKFTFDRMYHLPGVMNYLITMNVNSTEAIDTHHVRIVTNSEMPQIMLRILTCAIYSIVPKDNIHQTAQNETAWGSDDWGYDVFVGTGPYKLKEYTRDQKITFEKNANYWAERKGYEPTLQTVVYTMYGDAAALRMALESKAIDATWRGLDPLDIPDLEANPDIEVYETPYNLQNVELFPSAEPILNDTRIRQAIAYAINESQLLSVGWKSRGIVTYSHIPPSETFWYLPTFQKYECNITKAKELLAAAGYANGFTTDFYLMNEYVDTATIIKANLLAVGITLNLKLVDRVELRTLRRAGQVPMELSYWWPDYADPHNWVSELIEYHMSYAGWTNLEPFLDLADQAISESDENVRQEIYNQIQTLLAEEVWCYPVAYTYKSVAVQKYVQNFWYPYNLYSEVFGFGFCSIGPK